MMLLGLCFTAPLLANEVLRIESQAAEYSAQIYIQEEEKGSVPEKEKENDQKRKKLGIGETVILTLVSDKPQLIGVTAQDSCDMRDRLLRYFATCCQEKPLSGSLKRG